MVSRAGSVQITGFEETASFNAVLKEAETNYEAASDKAAALAEWQQVVTAAFEASPLAEVAHTIPAELKGRCERINIVAISGNYHAAAAAKLVVKGDPPAYLAAVEVEAGLDKVIGDEAAAAKNVVNCSRLKTGAHPPALPARPDGCLARPPALGRSSAYHCRSAPLPLWAIAGQRGRALCPRLGARWRAVQVGRGALSHATTSPLPNCTPSSLRTPPSLRTPLFPRCRTTWTAGWWLTELSK